MATSKSHNSVTVKDTCKTFAATGGFRGRAIKWYYSNFCQTHPCCHGNKLTSFGHKIGHYSVCIRDIIKILAPNIWFSGSANLTVLAKFVSD